MAVAAYLGPAVGTRAAHPVLDDGNVIDDPPTLDVGADRKCSMRFYTGG